MTFTWDVDWKTWAFGIGVTFDGTPMIGLGLGPLTLTWERK